MKHILPLFIILLSLIQVKVNAAERNFLRLQQIETLSNSTVFSLYQDGLGTIWLSTNYGLYRFNGISLEFMGSQSMKPICGNNADMVYAVTYDAIYSYNIRLRSENNIKIAGVDYQNCVMCATADSLWVASGSKIYLHTADETQLYHSISPNQASISTIVHLPNGALLIGTTNHGLYALSPQKQQSHVFSCKDNITALFVDSSENVWIGTMDNGAYRVSSNFEQMLHYNDDTPQHQRLTNNFVRTFCQDRGGAVWIGTLRGVNIFQNGTISSVEMKGIVNEASVWALLSDNQGGVWIGTFYDWVYYCMSDNYHFKDIRPKDDINRDIRLVNAMIEDSRGDVWLFTDNFGMFHIKGNDNSSIRYIADSDKFKFKSAYYDEQSDIIWVGTHMGSLKRYDIARGTWSDYTFVTEDGAACKETVNDIKEWHNRLFLGTSRGVIEFDPAEKKIVHKNIADYQGIVFSLAIDNRDRLWIGGTGIRIYDLIEARTEKYTLSDNKDADRQYSSDLSFIKLFRDSKGRIWGASLGQGLFMFDDQNQHYYTEQNVGLADNFTSFVTEIDSNLMLVGTNSGVSILNIEQNICYNYNKANGLSIGSARSGSFLKRLNGEIMIGGLDGIETINSENIEFSHDNIDIAFYKLIVNNKEIHPTADGKVLTVTLPYTKEIILNHNQTNVALEFTSQDFLKLYPIFYEYKLEGYDTEWVPFSIHNPVTFMNLHPNNYTMKVRATLSKNSGEYKQIELKIKVKPAWYATTLAKIIYVCLALLVIFWVLYFAYSKMLFKQLLNQKERENVERMRFFITMSHDIRTPLTLIIGQLKLFLRQNEDNNCKGVENIVGTYNNANRMQQIVSNLLDFEKHNQGYMVLSISKVSLREFTKQSLDAFKQYADYRNIEFNIQLPSQDISLYLDTVQMQRVFSNLLINAFKYTSSGGKIEIKVSEIENTQKDEHIKILFCDNGKGISEEVLPYIFDQFYQGTATTTYDRHNSGTGIGLALCKGIVEMHHGTITVSSSLGQGTTFAITLPVGESWFVDDARISLSEVSEINDPQTDIVEIMVAPTSEKQPTKHHPFKMLIVEDDDEMSEMLKLIFQNSYHVYQAANGAEGLSSARDLQPDIIISDVMMPIMDGLSFCAAVKDDFRTCHIPIILLTARTGTQQSIEGLNVGADDYILKPFNIELIEARCLNILNNRRRMQMKFSNSEAISENMTTNEKDSNFIDSVIDVIERNLFTNQLSVTTLCSELNIGKTLLTIKLKGISGHSPREFIEIVKLKRAAVMLREKEINISEIAYDLGFSSPKYFTIRFKKLFGKSPSAFVQENR